MKLLRRALIVCVSLAAPTVVGAASIYVPAGGDLQAALNRAAPGDRILLEPGATFVGPFTLPRKTSESGRDVVIRTATPDDQLPPGRRVGPADAPKMAMLVARSGAVIRTAPGSGRYRLVGLEIAPAPGVALINLVLLGSWTADGRWTETRVEELPHDITLDRVYVHGDPMRGSRRGLAMNGRNIAVHDSYFADFKDTCCDSQAIAGWNGPGPFTIHNNYLEAAGENVMFGGADPSIAGLVPADIDIRGNHFAKPLRWKPDDPSYEGTDWVVKNLLELKNARNVAIDGNLFEHNWADDQNGFAILFTPRNQDGGSHWSTVENVVFTGNVVRHSTSGINILGWDNLGPSGQARNILIRDNLFWDIGGARWGEDAPQTYGYGAGGWFLQLMDGTDGVVVEHNTVFASKGILVADTARPAGPRGTTAHTRFVFRQNIVRHGSIGIGGGATPAGQPTLDHYFFDPVVQGNLVIGGEPTASVATLSVPAIDDVGFEDWVRCDFRLARSSPYLTAATHGRAIGATPAPWVPAACGDGGYIDSPWLFARP